MDRRRRLQALSITVKLALIVVVVATIACFIRWHTAKRRATNRQSNHEGRGEVRTSMEPASPSLPARFPIADRVRSYPALHRALGDSWVSKEETTHPAKSRNALARWLRIDGYDVRPSMLDRLLAMFENRSGMGERRARLKGDPLSLEATVVELHFAGWLDANGFPFELTKEGPDFKVQLAGDSCIEIEVTTPRQDVWFTELFDRLMYLKREYGFSLRFGFHREDLPDNGVDVNRLDSALTEEVVLEIASEALAKIESAKGPSTPESPAFVQSRPAIGLRATWWNDDTQYMSGATGPATGHAWGIWWSIRNAAVQKTKKQLPPDRSYCLLIGADKLNDGDRRMWADWVERLQDEDVPIRWSVIPPQIKYVIIYKVSWSELEPACALLLINDESSFPHVDGIEDFKRKLFPIRYRTISSRYAVWASTERCMDRRWF